jgi:hypothetical protein
MPQHRHAQNHDQQPDGDNNQQGEAEPAHDHGAGAHAREHAAVAEVLGDDAGGDRRRVLPEDRHEHKDGGDEDDGQRDLADGARREGLDLALGALVRLLLVPAGEGGEQEEADEGEDDGDDAVSLVSGAEIL